MSKSTTSGHDVRFARFRIEEHLDRILGRTQHVGVGVVHAHVMADRFTADMAEAAADHHEVARRQFVDVVDFGLADDEADAGVMHFFLADAGDRP